MPELIPRTTIAAIVSNRDAALARIQQGADLLELGFTLVKEARLFAEKAHGGELAPVDRSQHAPRGKLFCDFVAGESVEAYRQQLDSRVWMHLVVMTGLNHMMDRTAIDELHKELCTTVPVITEDNVRDVFETLAGDAHLMFARGLARAFGDLDRRFKSHDAFKLGSRIILTNVFDAWGMWNYHSCMRETLTDIERVFAILDGEKPNPTGLRDSITEDRKGGGFNPRQSLTETKCFKIRTFKNGNCHLWFVRDDLVTMANQVLADYYGAVLPDGVQENPPEKGLRSRSGALSRDLAFYPTPEEVVKLALRSIDINESSVVLEPSAGTGNMVSELLNRDAHVMAFEVDPTRCTALRNISWGNKLTVRCTNFLREVVTPRFTHVVMNPPFYGIHWMQHVIHAFDFLKPGGTLVAILPISADLGQTKKHVDFRKWAKQHASHYGSMFRDLPAESFAKSGTRISTVVLTLHKANER